MNTEYYKTAAEHTDENERLLIPPFRRTQAQSKDDRRLVDFIQDAAAFIHSKGTWSSDIVLATLVHDITGLANNEPCFSPRVTGYAQRERQQEPREGSLTSIDIE
jgi:hypothetical protein